ncbi:MAG: glycosyltransferase family 2 protein [Prevotella sp.]|nr:glycosyltransferase family 2 protein [Prevotella sp.]
MKKLTVVIVNYNVKYYIDQCLHSLRKALEDIDAEVYVVDNHSRDGSVAYIKKRHPKVHVVSSNHNLGFSRANNIAIRQSESEYVLLLNPDTIVGEGTIRETLSFMDAHPEAGATGVKMLNRNGSNALESRRGLPSPMTSLYKLLGLCNRYPKSRKFGRYYMSYLPWDKPSQIEIISGAYCMVRRTALNEAGLLDEDFFMYGEDIDLSYRLLKKGFQNWYLPTHILHYKGESTHKSSFRYVHVFYEAMLIFFRKHYGHMSFVVTLPIKAAIYGKATLELIGMVPSLIRDALGLRIRRHVKFPEYIFFGREHAINKCRRLARNKGVSAQFVVGDEQSIPNGHLDHLDLIQPGQTTYVVYDTDSFSYDSIFRIFSSRPMDNVYIGTYHPKDNLVITDKEVLKNGNY